MKICFLGNADSVHVHRWIRYFADEGHTIHLISLKALKPFPVANVQLHTLQVVRSMGGIPLSSPLRRFNLPSVVRQVKGLLKQIQPDIVHAHNMTDSGIFAALSGFHPLVVTAWGSDVLLSPKKSVILRMAAKYVLAKADLITCDADHMVTAMTKLGALPEKIRVIFFGTDVKKYSPQQRDVSFKPSINIPDTAPTVISLRMLRPIYDIESLVRAVPVVLEHVPDAYFIIGGNGELRPQLEALAQSLGVIEQTKFVGALNQDEMPIYLASSDVYVSTSLSDAGLSASTAEAMASGLPVVITNFGDNADWVQNGEGGFLVPLQNPATLAEKITWLLQHPQQRVEFGKTNRKVIKTRNNYYVEMEKVESLYKMLAKEL